MTLKQKNGYPFSASARSICVTVTTYYLPRARLVAIGKAGTCGGRKFILFCYYLITRIETKPFFIRYVVS
jgi:hypothetical protein